MLSKFKFFGAMVMAGSIIFAAGCSKDEDNTMSPQVDKSKVRVIHASYDAPAVDIRVDGVVAISQLSYGESSGYAEVNSGVRNVQVTPAGATSPVVIEANLPVEANMEYTVIAVDELSSITPIVAVDNRTVNPQKAKIRFVHASPDAPGVDIKVSSGNSAPVFSGAEFGDISNYVEVDQGTYQFVVTPAGSTTEVLVFDPIQVANGMIYTVIAHGTFDPNDQYPFAVRVFVDNEMGAAFADLSIATSSVMVVHASPDAPGVAVLVDNIIVNSAALTFPNFAGYLEVNAGTRNLKVNVFGTTTTVIDANVNLAGDAAYSVFAVNSVSNIEPLVLEDDLTAPANGKAHVRFIHLSPDAPAVDITLTDGTVVFGNKAFKEFTEFTPLDAGTYDLQVRAAGTSTVVLDLPGISLSSGTIYTVFAKGFLNGSGSQALGAEIIVNN